MPCSGLSDVPRSVTRTSSDGLWLKGVSIDAGMRMNSPDTDRLMNES